MKRSLLLALLGPIVLAGSLHAAADYFLEIDGVKGESSDSARPETIEILSFSWGANNAGSATGAGTFNFSDLRVKAAVSKASPQLMLACATGRHIPSATIYVRKAGSETEEYLMITMSDVLVSSYQTSGQGASQAGGDSRPTEEVAFYYNKVALAHTADDGTVTSAEATRTPAQ